MAPIAIRPTASSGATNTYEYGAEWQPIDDFRLRASYQRAVRAPNVLELFAPAEHRAHVRHVQ